MKASILRRPPFARLLLALALVALAPEAVTAGEVDERESRGAFLYRVYCASCHGAEGRGNGPVADELRTHPADLTRLGDSRGHFDRHSVMEQIDGRTEIPSHGPREMPVWGLSFQTAGRATDQEAEVQERLRALVAFLEEIQEEPRR